MLKNKIPLPESLEGKYWENQGREKDLIDALLIN